MQLTPISPDEYARAVLPRSFDLWATGRSLAEYVEDFHATAASRFGRRHFRTVGLRVGGTIVASCKRYERDLRCGEQRLRATGLGAVFTPPELRGRGFATVLVGSVLDALLAAGKDVAYLFSDIHPTFYERLGFIALPSRAWHLHADALPARRIAVADVTAADEPAIARCFAMLDGRRPIAFVRTPLFWEWRRLAARFDRTAGQAVCLAARRGSTLCAYVAGRRIPTSDAFVLDEFGYIGDVGFDAIAPLVRCAAGDLQHVTGWLPPDLARAALPRGAVTARKQGILMIAPLSRTARAAWRRQASALLADDADRCWSTDHV